MGEATFSDGGNAGFDLLVRDDGRVTGSFGAYDKTGDRMIAVPQGSSDPVVQLSGSASPSDGHFTVSGEAADVQTGVLVTFHVTGELPATPGVQLPIRVRLGEATASGIVQSATGGTTGTTIAP